MQVLFGMNVAIIFINPLNFNLFSPKFRYKSTARILNSDPNSEHFQKPGRGYVHGSWKRSMG